MAIQMRRGLKADFDPTKMLPGEWAVSIDENTNNQIVWMCFAPGKVKRMGTFDDLHAELDPIMEATWLYSEEAKGYSDSAVVAKNDAASSALKASSSETKAKEYMERAFSGTPEGYDELVDRSVLHNALVRTVRKGDSVTVKFKIRNLRYDPSASFTESHTCAWTLNVFGGIPPIYVDLMFDKTEQYRDITKTVNSTANVDYVKVIRESQDFDKDFEILDFHCFVNGMEVIMPLPTAQGGIRINEVVGKSVKSGNLIDVVENGGYTSTGADTESGIIVRTKYIAVKPSTSYSISSDVTNAEYFVYCFAEKGTTNVKAITWTQNDTFTTTSDTKYVRCAVRKSDNSTLMASDVKKFMLNEGNTALPYEPFGIRTSAEQGFFDGELLQGAYASQTISVNDRFVSTANIISCKSGDVVGVKYGLPKTSESRIFVSFWNDDTYVSNTIINDFEGDATVPSGINGVRVCIGWSTSSSNKTTPSEALANGISITINGQYAVCVREHNEDSSESKTIFIPTSSPLASVGELHNRIVKVGEKWYEHRVAYSYYNEGVGIVESSGIVQIDRTDGRPMADNTDAYNVICDKIPSYSDGATRYISLTKNSLRFYGYTMQEVQALLPLHIIYPIPEEYIEITDQTALYQLESYADATYIEVADGLTTLDVDYGMSDVSATALNGERLAELEKWERRKQFNVNGYISPKAGLIATHDVEGGYVRIGNLVIVNARFVSDVVSGANVALYGFPKPLLVVSATVMESGHTHIDGWINTDGGIVINGYKKDIKYTVSATYICADDSASAAPMMASEE